MNGKELLRELSRVDEAFLADAMTEMPPRKHHWRKYAAAAACLFLAAGAGLWWSQRPYVIRLDQVAVNPVSTVHRTEPTYDPATVETLLWEKEQVTEYYGKDLTPAYIPEDLEPVSDGTAEVLVEADGTVVFDAVELDFYTGYGPDGTLGPQPVQGFSMTVSTGDVLIYEYADPETGRQMFSVNGVEVTLGEITLNDQRGEYAAFGAYAAEFTLGELRYALCFHQMEMEEVLKVVASIIQNSDNVLVK